MGASSVRRAIAFVSPLLFLLAAVLFCSEQGWLRPIRILESSMAPHFLGDHLVVRCTRCDRPYPIAPLNPATADQRGVCAHCGSLNEVIQPERFVRGDRVLVRKRRPQPLRWSAVALRDPHATDARLIKRIVGLPGETVSLQGGDVFIDGQRHAKSLSELRTLAIPIFDTPTAAVPRDPAWLRWRAESGWELGSNGYTRLAPARDEWSWLSFQGNDVPGRRAVDSLLLDDYPFNTSLSRVLHPVRDFLLRCVLKDVRRGAVGVRLLLRERVIQVVWQSTVQSVILSVDGQTIAQRQLPNAHTDQEVTMEFAICDGRVHFALNSLGVLSVPLPSSISQGTEGLQRLEIGAGACRLVVSHIELLRDVYYLPRNPVRGERHPVHWKLADDQVFVLGDNSPVSVDSRDFGPLRLADLLGTVRLLSRSDR